MPNPNKDLNARSFVHKLRSLSLRYGFFSSGQFLPNHFVIIRVEFKFVEENQLKIVTK